MFENAARVVTDKFQKSIIRCLTPTSIRPEALKEKATKEEETKNPCTYFYFQVTVMRVGGAKVVIKFIDVNLLSASNSCNFDIQTSKEYIHNKIIYN
jgi:hypothetical protein